MLSNLTKKNFRSKRRSCALCKPQKMHWTDSRTVQVQREAWRHKEQLEKPNLRPAASANRSSAPDRHN